MPGPPGTIRSWRWCWSPVAALTSRPAGRSGSSSRAASWVFPFDKPLAPGKGDNQALAVNTTDNTVHYDVAFALVWVEDDSPALNKNEAYAFASCKSCAAVSVGFQVVLVTGHNHVAVPQNIAEAVNYNCVDCLTYALATQLFVTLDGPLSVDRTKQLNALWQQIADFGAHISSVPLDEIRDQLTSYQQQILDIVGADTRRNPTARSKRERRRTRAPRVRHPPRPRRAPPTPPPATAPPGPAPTAPSRTRARPPPARPRPAAPALPPPTPGPPARHTADARRERVRHALTLALSPVSRSTGWPLAVRTSTAAMSARRAAVAAVRRMVRPSTERQVPTCSVRPSRVRTKRV